MFCDAFRFRFCTSSDLLPGDRVVFVLQSEPAGLSAGLPVQFTSESPQRQQQQAGEPAGDAGTPAAPHGAGEPPPRF